MISAWMLYGAGVSLLLGCSALALERTLRLYGRPTRWVWAAGIVSGPLVMIWTAVAHPTREAIALADEVSAVPVGMPVSPSSALLVGTEMPPGVADVDSLLVHGWAVFSLVLALGLAFSLISLRRQRRTWRREAVCGVPVFISRDVGPATFGFFRAAVVLPEWVLSWDDERMHLVLAHEQEHIRARDPQLFLVAVAAAILTPWNLAIWWQLRRLRLAIEVDCDARIVGQQVDVRSYGTLLLDVGQWSSISYLPVTAFSQPRSFLERRIRAMAAPRPHRPLLTATLLCSLFSVGIGTAVSMPRPDPPDLFRAASDRLRAEPLGVSIATELPVLELPSPQPGSGTGRGEGNLAPMKGPQSSAAEDTIKPILQNPAAVQRALEANYPPLLRDAGVMGTVLLEVATDESGRVRETRTVRTTHQAFGEAARRALAGARFSPAQTAGRPVPFQFTLPVRFDLPTPDADLPVVSTAGPARVAGREKGSRAEDASGGSVTDVPATTSRVRAIEAEEQALAVRERTLAARGHGGPTHGTTRMREQFEETHARIRSAVKSHYPEAFSQGLDPDKYLWFLVSPSGKIEQTGVAGVEWEPNGWSSTSIVRTLRTIVPAAEVQHSHHAAGLQMGAGAKVNVAWITRN